MNHANLNHATAPLDQIKRVLHNNVHEIPARVIDQRLARDARAIDQRISAALEKSAPLVRDVLKLGRSLIPHGEDDQLLLR